MLAGYLMTGFSQGIASAEGSGVDPSRDRKTSYGAPVSGKNIPDDPSLPEARVLVRPKDSPLPASGVPVAPWPGLATMVVPSVDEYQGAKTFHKMELDDLTGKEGLSWLLPSELDAQRRTDMEDPYYVPTAGSGHLVPQIMPFRERLQKKGFVFSFSYKGEAMANIHGGMRRGMDYVHELTLQMNFDLGKMAGWNGWSVHTLLMNRAGREVSHDRVGDYYVNLMEVRTIRACCGASG